MNLLLNDVIHLIRSEFWQQHQKSCLISQINIIYNQKEI